MLLPFRRQLAYLRDFAHFKKLKEKRPLTEKEQDEFLSIRRRWGFRSAPPDSNLKARGFPLALLSSLTELGRRVLRVLRPGWSNNDDPLFAVEYHIPVGPFTRRQDVPETFKAIRYLGSAERGWESAWGSTRLKGGSPGGGRFSPDRAREAHELHEHKGCSLGRIAKKLSVSRTQASRDNLRGHELCPTCRAPSAK